MKNIDPSSKIILITGAPGVGKTTLAEALLNHERFYYDVVYLCNDPAELDCAEASGAALIIVTATDRQSGVGSRAVKKHIHVEA